jgi:hypothetical protein
MQRFLCDHDTGNREDGSGDSPGDFPAASGGRAATCCVCLVGPHTPGTLLGRSWFESTLCTQTAPAATVLLPCGEKYFGFCPR